MRKTIIFRFSFSGINDFHGQLEVYRTVEGKGKLGGGSRCSLKKHKQENENTLLLHVGDSVGASAPIFRSSAG